MLFADNIVTQSPYPDAGKMNASHDCLNVQEAKVLVTANAVFAVIGALANLAAILIIVLTRSLQHVYRLTLYLGLLGLVVSVLIGFETLPVDTERPDYAPAVVWAGWNGTCAAIGFVTQHLAISKGLANLAVCSYIFTVAMFPGDARLQRCGYEVAGVVAILVLPAAITLVPLVVGRDNLGYGLNGAWCWIREDCKAHSESLRLELALTVSTEIVPHALSLILICAVIGRLCTRMGKAQTRLWSVLKEIIPLLCFPALEALVLVIAASSELIFSKNVGSYEDASRELAVVCLLQVVSLALPVSLWLHPSVRHRCARVRGQRQLLVESSATTTAEDASMVRHGQRLAGSERDPLLKIRAS